jgi:hypothetical protein
MHAAPRSDGFPSPATRHTPHPAGGQPLIGLNDHAGATARADRPGARNARPGGRRPPAPRPVRRRGSAPALSPSIRPSPTARADRPAPPGPLPPPAPPGAPGGPPAGSARPSAYRAAPARPSPWPLPSLPAGAAPRPRPVCRVNGRQTPGDTAPARSPRRRCHHALRACTAGGPGSTAPPASAAYQLLGQSLCRSGSGRAAALLLGLRSPRQQVGRGLPPRHGPLTGGPEARCLGARHHRRSPLSRPPPDSVNAEQGPTRPPSGPLDGRGAAIPRRARPVPTGAPEAQA